MKRRIAANGADPYEYHRDRVTGIITSPMRTALVYAGYQGTLTWRAWNYHHKARCLYNFVMRHTAYQNVRDDLRLGILLIGSPKDLEKICHPYLQEYSFPLSPAGSTILLPLEWICSRISGNMINREEVARFE